MCLTNVLNQLETFIRVKKKLNKLLAVNKNIISLFCNKFGLGWFKQPFQKICKVYFDCRLLLKFVIYSSILSENDNLRVLFVTSLRYKNAFFMFVTVKNRTKWLKLLIFFDNKYFNFFYRYV